MNELRLASSLVVVLVALAGCESPPPATPTDGGGGGTDGGGADAGDPTTDGGRVDAPMLDAGTDAGAELAPIFRNPLSTPDAELAQQALRLMGSSAAGGSGSCSTCHGITRQTIRYWRALTDTANDACFTDLDVRTSDAARDIVLCFRGGVAGAPFHSNHLGVFATAARLDWMRFVFRRWLGGDDTPAYNMFVEAAGMPPDPHTPFTQAEFDIIAEWFLRGVPELEAVLPEDPRPTDCTPGVSADVRAHVTAMATTGWAARNAEDGILMYGCAGAASARACLATETAARTTAYGATWDVVPGTTLRVLYSTGYESSYWTRSSADGRFVGQGGGSPRGASVVDLNTDRHIAIDAMYDPAFFPDNSGFMFLGGGGVCEQSVLTTGMPTVIDFTEAGCRSTAMVGLYEHVGASLAGGDYWAIHGQFVSDDGGHRTTMGGPDARFGSDSITRLTRMVNTGSGFMAVETLSVPTPYEGDAAISPSSRLVVSRVAGPSARQIGFVLRRVDTEMVGGRLTATLPEIGRYCFDGAKVAFSYDERWMITHHYISGTSAADARELGFTGTTDPGFAEYRTRGAANIYLIDMLTGATTRITNMGPGQYALFPHFRSDGWIYFIVRAPGTGTERIVASDAAFALTTP